MSAVDDSVEDHDQDYNEDKPNHLSWQCIALKLVWQVVIHRFHHKVEE